VLTAVTFAEVTRAALLPSGLALRTCQQTHVRACLLLLGLFDCFSHYDFRGSACQLPTSDRSFRRRSPVSSRAFGARVYLLLRSV